MLRLPLRESRNGRTSRVRSGIESDWVLDSTLSDSLSPFRDFVSCICREGRVDGRVSGPPLAGVAPSHGPGHDRDHVPGQGAHGPSRDGRTSLLSRLGGDHASSTGIDGGAKPWDPPIERDLTKSNWSGFAEHGAAPSIEGPQLLPPAAIRFFHQARACRSNVCRFADRVLLPEQQLCVQFDRRSVLVFRRWTQGSGMRHAPS